MELPEGVKPAAPLGDAEKFTWQDPNDPNEADPTEAEEKPDEPATD